MESFAPDPTWKLTRSHVVVQLVQDLLVELEVEDLQDANQQLQLVNETRYIRRGVCGHAYLGVGLGVPVHRHGYGVLDQTGLREKLGSESLDEEVCGE